jgi:hypothetical protein
MKELFEPEKLIWSDSDFEAMSWHDNSIHSFAFVAELFEFRIDLDYIFKWVKLESEKYYSFWVSPCTLCFENASELIANFSIGNQYYDLEIYEIKRSYIGKSENQKFDNWRFEIETNNGNLTVEATGFKMFVRAVPLLINGQKLTLQQRGGLCLNLT